MGGKQGGGNKGYGAQTYGAAAAKRPRLDSFGGKGGGGAGATDTLVIFNLAEKGYTQATLQPDMMQLAGFVTMMVTPKDAAFVKFTDPAAASAAVTRLKSNNIHAEIAKTS